MPKKKQPLTTPKDKKASTAPTGNPRTSKPSSKRQPKEWSPYGTIQVKGARFSVKLIEGLKQEKGLFGLCDPENFEIWIDASISQEQRKITLVHELTHAVFSQTGLSALVHTKVEEAIVTGLEQFLYDYIDFDKLGLELSHGRG